MPPAGAHLTPRVAGVMATHHAAHDPPAAHADDQRRRDCHQELDQGHHCRREPSRLDVGAPVVGVDCVEAADVLILPREALHDPHPGHVLLEVGVYDGDGLPHLRDHAEGAGLDDCVLFPGWIEHELAPNYVAAADAIVNPYRDTLINRAKCAGKVVMAMAMGKAVVTSRMGENLEYIEDGHSGLLTRPGDVDELADALLSVLSDRDWADELGRNAQKRIWEAYDWDARVGDVERAYRIALVQSRGDA